MNKKLIQALEQILNLVSQKIDIQEIYIECTTNGKHGIKSNHYAYHDAKALDISRINEKMMKGDLGENHIWIKIFQEAIDKLPNVRENFGPCFLHKGTKLPDNISPKFIEDHKDHIHFSINL